MSKKYFIFFLSFVPFIVSAQSWEWAKNYGTSSPLLIHSGQSISRDGQNNIYVTGFSWSPSEATYTGYAYNWLKKFDSQGNLIWSDTIPFYTAETKCTTDKTGETYVVGNGRIVKYNTNGSQSWAISTPIDFRGVSLSEKGIVVVGYTWAYTATMGTYNIPSETGVIVECDKNGNLLWLTQHHKFGPGAVQVALNGIVYVQGLPFDGHDSSAVRLFDSNGNYFKGIVKSRQTHSFIKTDNNQNVYLIAGIDDHSPLIINSDTIRCYCGFTSSHVIIKLNTDGEYQWYKMIKGNIDVSAFILDDKDNIYVGGNILGTSQIDSFLLENKAGSVYVAKFKPNGTIEWVQYSEQVIPTAPGQLNDMILDSDNNPLITGNITYKHTFGNITVTGHNNLFSDALIAKISQPRIVSQNEPKTNPTNGLSVYPNPTSGIFTLLYSTERAINLDLSVKNCLGQTILSKQYSQQKQVLETLDLSRMAKGIYFVHLKSSEANEVQKIVIE